MRHSYGNSHSLTIEYRLARSAFRYLDTQAVNQTPQLGTASLGSVYDVFFLQYASIEPDPIKRDQLVRAFLQGSGINPDTQLVNRVLTNTPVLARQQQLSYSISGVRTSLVLSAQRSATERLGSASGVVGDLSQFENVVQRGVSVTLSHQLTPSSSAGLSFSMLHNSGLGGSTLQPGSTKLRSLVANWSSRIANRTSVGLMVRHTDSDGIYSYRENAASVNLTQLF
jgi:uncharacterized protein (PEP-CTERM system associated)